VGQTVVIALGGNAILQPGQAGTASEQRATIAVACAEIARVLDDGHRVVLTHGNGPQVGNILLQNEEARNTVPPMPLDICGAQSQGMLGYLFQQELQRQTGRPVVSLVTQVEVDPEDPAFSNPTKPVGPFYTPERARRMMAEAGWTMREDAGRGWRRVVPSPRPVRVVEAGLIASLVEQGALVIACGGGGVPVARRAGGPAAVAAGGEGLVGVEAVIDKDLCAYLLAQTLGAELLVILTDVPHVYIHYRDPAQQALGEVPLHQMERYMADGHFKAGSMAPKVAAAMKFVRGGGQRAAIGSLAQAAEAVRGRAGTQVVKG
jgi:carbamate kinase